MSSDQQPARPRLRGFFTPLTVIGPGIVVAGSVMGSGELINTPVQAAKYGFVLLWAVLVSCLIKFFLQVEIGRHALVQGRTTFQALNICPGPRWRGTSWVGLMYMLGYAVSMMITVGIIGSLGGLMHTIYPIATTQSTSLQIWSLIIVLLTAALLWKGFYRHLELLVALLVGVFSISLVIGVAMIQGTEFRISWADIAEGLTFSLSPGELRQASAFAVVSLMGALGTAANELFMYPYWVLEKGYGRDLADRNAPGWTEKARRWIRILYLDAGVATILATLMTAAFFLLGAAVLHGRGTPPSGTQVVDRISAVYVESYGPASRYIFLAGAFCTLFSTLVVIVAASGRMWGDMLASLGFLDRRDEQTMRRSHQVAQILWLAGLYIGYMLLPQGQPAELIVYGHSFLAAFCGPLLMGAICWMAFHTDARARMTRLTAFLLVTTTVLLTVCVLTGLWVSLFASGE